MSRVRGQHLESLVEFMHSATQELIWLNEKEETELSRDWSARDLAIQDIQEYHTVRNDMKYNTY